MAMNKAGRSSGARGGSGQRSRDLSSSHQRRFNTQQQKRSLASIFIIGLFVLSGFVVMVQYAFPGHDEGDTFYGLETFIYNPRHQAERGGGADFMLYIKNTGNAKDTFMVSLQNNIGGFKASFEPEEVTLDQGGSAVVIVRTIASSSSTGLMNASVAVQSRGNYELTKRVPFEVEVVESQGDPVTGEDSVGMWYIGSLESGVLFDTNLKAVYDNDSIPKDGVSDHPQIFDMKPIQDANVIDGWKTNAVGMKLGQSIVVKLPPDQAYGEKSPQNTHTLAGKTLIFEMTLGQIY